MMKGKIENKSVAPAKENKAAPAPKPEPKKDK